MTYQDKVSQALRKMDEIIAPEHRTDKLADIIIRLVSTRQFKTILEIGSSSGEGSTAAFVRGLYNNPESNLFCIELSRVRFQRLKDKYKNTPQVKCYNVGSTNKFISREDVIDFYNIVRTKKNDFILDTVLAWYEGDVAYSRLANTYTNGIEVIKHLHHITNFDMVLIDGSGYNSRDELRQVYGARCIILDDIDSIKNYLNYYDLVEDPQYILVEQNWETRNGYAVFMRAPYQQGRVNIPPFKLNCQGIQKTLSAKPLEQIYGDLIYRVQDHIATCKECHLFMEEQRETN